MAELNDPGWDALFERAGQLHNVDPLLLKSLMFTESGRATTPEGRLSITSPAGAVGPMQFLPSTANQFKIDPADPYEAINGAAQYLSNSLDKYNGDVTKALMSYHGGYDQSKWGPRTRAYPVTVGEYYAQLTKPQQPTPEAASWVPQVIFGDSLAQQANNHAKVGGDFKVGRNPQDNLTALQKYLQEHPDVNGQNWLVSTGISNAIAAKNGRDFTGNAMAAMPYVEAQLYLLQQSGAHPVVLGVGPHPGLAGVNEALQDLAKTYGAAYAPLVGPFEPTNIHPKNGRATLEGAVRAARELWQTKTQ